MEANAAPLRRTNQRNMSQRGSEHSLSGNAERSSWGLRRLRSQLQYYGTTSSTVISTNLCTSSQGDL